MTADRRAVTGAVTRLANTVTLALNAYTAALRHQQLIRELVAARAELDAIRTDLDAVKTTLVALRRGQHAIAGQMGGEWLREELDLPIDQQTTYTS